MILPKDKVKATRKNPRLLMLYGPPKVGKTTLLSELENCLTIDLEKGSNYLDILKIEVNSLKELEKVGNAIIEANRPYKYLAIDTATKLEEWCEDFATILYKASAVGKNFSGNSVLELPNGGGYYWLRIAYGKWFNFCANLAEYLILIAHVRDKMLVDKKGVEIKGGQVSSMDLDLTGKIKAITCSKADAIGLLTRKVVGAENGEPVSKMFVNFNSSTEILCGSRCKHLLGKEMEFNWSDIFIKEGE